ncbi:MAG: ferritin [Synergistaceae bacterium]|nr:ferritin [Synergistaceae bacterium]MBQ6111702.1 ferritin [Synergistaceae bacterium]MBQ9629826.1 ferritin [Synergistaceae bacterium]MBR0249523.1 ferritin [Synergistaceae bacterium]
MKISDSMTAAINDQIKAEFDSAYIYLAMSAYLKDAGLDGMSHWMHKQYKEEVEHAEKFISYLYERGARVIIPDIAKPKDTYENALEVFRTAYAHEQYVTSRIYKLVDLAVSEKDYATQSMLKWYVDEQMEEEDNTGGIVSKLEFLGGDKHGVYTVDRELASR